MSLTELQYEMIISNQPEVATKFQTVNQPIPTLHPSSKFITLAPLTADSKDLLKMPTTPISPIGNTRKNKKGSKLFNHESQSKDYNS